MKREVWGAFSGKEVASRRGDKRRTGGPIFSDDFCGRKRNSREFKNNTYRKKQGKGKDSTHQQAPVEESGVRNRTSGD